MFPTKLVTQNAELKLKFVGEAQAKGAGTSNKQLYNGTYTV